MERKTHKNGDNSDDAWGWAKLSDLIFSSTHDQSFFKLPHGVYLFHCRHPTPPIFLYIRHKTFVKHKFQCFTTNFFDNI